MIAFVVLVMLVALGEGAAIIYGLSVCAKHLGIITEMLKDRDKGMGSSGDRVVPGTG